MFTGGYIRTICVGLLVVALGATPAFAVTFNVDSTSDLPDADTTNPACDDGDGNCTLRAAVEQANSFFSPGKDTIVVPAGQYNLGSALSLSSELDIAGAGAANTLIAQTGTARVFDVTGGSVVGIQGVTMSGGTANFTNGSFGGNLRSIEATVTLDDSIVSGGNGDSGGGLSNVGGTMTVRRSLLTDNHAESGGGDSGAIQNTNNGSTGIGRLTVENSTITGNTARLAGGIAQGGNGGSTLVSYSTITGNSSGPRTDLPSAGGLTVFDGTVTVRGSIVAENSSVDLATPNCASDPTGAAGGDPGIITSAGGNIEGGTDCGFGAANDQASTDPQLGALGDNGGPTFTRMPLTTSPALNSTAFSFPTCPATDQRGVARPQGSACDAGAVEVVVAQVPPDPPAKPKKLADLPPPVIGKVANVEPAGGSVLVAVPAGATLARSTVRTSQKGLKFVPLREARQVPVGSFLDTRRGTVRLQTAASARGTRQTSSFSQGLFQIFQSRKARKGLTEVRLKGSSFKRCGRPSKGRAGAAALSKRRVRRLRGNGRGRFSTRGRHSSATVRGTVWTVTDRCDGTLTKVTRGKVAVRDFRRKKTIVLKAGKSHLAKARR